MISISMTGQDNKCTGDGGTISIRSTSTNKSMVSFLENFPNFLLNGKGKVFILNHEVQNVLTDNRSCSSTTRAIKNLQNVGMLFMIKDQTATLIC